MKIYPSLISSNLLQLEETLHMLNPRCDGYHLDVMDDHFVPNLTWGPAFVNAIKAKTSLPLHIHLMVTDPASWLERLDLTTHDCFIFHYEAVANPIDQHDLIKKIHAKGWRAGIAINPNTPVDSITSLLPDLDIVLIMSVQPGFSGQAFMPSVLEKISLLFHEKKAHNYPFRISMDGGINQQTIGLVTATHAVEHIAVASAIFNQPDPCAALQQLYTRTQ